MPVAPPALASAGDDDALLWLIEVGQEHAVVRIVDQRAGRHVDDQVFADIPGLIEGAQHGAGLGHAFLRHIERTKIIVHLLDLFPMDGSDPAANYRKIRAELEAFSPALAEKREVIAANKMDLATDDTALDKLMNALPEKEIFAISGVSHQGVEPLLETLWATLKSEDPSQSSAAPPRGLPLHEA
jgi:GTP-binding protein